MPWMTFQSEQETPCFSRPPQQITRSQPSLAETLYVEHTRRMLASHQAQKGIYQRREQHLQPRFAPFGADVRRARVVARTATLPQETTVAPLTSPSWQRFAASFSGEWEGVTAGFSPDGTPVPLPEHFVPQAFRDWSQDVYDWQSTCSTHASPHDTKGEVNLLCRRMMPTVGCEADAIAYTEDPVQKGQLAAFAPDGSYISGPRELLPSDNIARIEVCLIVTPPEPDSSDPPAAGEEAPPVHRAVRVRLQHHLTRDLQTKQWKLVKVDVHHERWDSPYRGLVELSGCGGGMPAFAKTDVVAEDLVLPHKPANEWTKAWSQPGAEAQDLLAGSSVPHEVPTELVRLPLGLWLRTGVVATETGTDVEVEVGGLVRAGAGQLVPGAEPAMASVAQCSYRDSVMTQAVVGKLDYSEEEVITGTLFTPVVAPWDTSSSAGSGDSILNSI